jgi:CRISPR-associated protein Cmr4
MVMSATTGVIEMKKTEVKMILWQALTSVHVGTGQDSSSVIDLPIMREKATGYPIFPGSSIKGVIRGGRDDLNDFGYVRKEKSIEEGKEVIKEIAKAGELTFTDARVLCLPVRSYQGTFAFLTCPLIIERLERDLAAFGLDSWHKEVFGLEQTDIVLSSDSKIKHGSQVILEDIDLNIKPQNIDDLAKAWSWQIFGTDHSYFVNRFAVVSNDVFDFFSQTATEVVARIKLEETSKTVASGGLWYEENLPAETLLLSFVLSEKGNFAEVEKLKTLQIGGDASTGRGLLKVMVK